MRDVLLAKITISFVPYFANSALLPSISTSDTMTLSHRKSHSGLFRGRGFGMEDLPSIHGYVVSKKVKNVME